MKSLIKILKLHDIDYYVTDNKVIADGDDVTNYSIEKLKKWLGY